MRYLIALVARLYPRSWRAEFGEEFDAVLGDVRPRWRVFANVLGGAIAMQISAGTGWMKLAGVMAVVGAIAGMGLSFTATPRYLSSAVVGVTTPVDPLRPASPEVLRERSARHVAEVEAQVLSRAELSQTIQAFHLYQGDLGRMPLQDVIEKMRSNIRIETRPAMENGDIVFVSFSYWDQATAESVTHELSRKFREQSALINRSRRDMYLGFWADMSVKEHTKATPPPPVGENVMLLNPANYPMTPISPNRIPYLAWGLGGGLLLGMVTAFWMRWPRVALPLAAFALAGCVAGGAASLAIPDRYISTSVMMIEPALITEDPLTPGPGATSATEFLRTMEPEVLSVQNLSRIIQEPSLNLYSSERAKKPIDEVVRSMLAHDLRIAPVAGPKNSASAIRISFSYPDRYKARQVVWWVENEFDRLNQSRQRKAADASGSVLLLRLTQRKGGERLYILDVANLPVSPAGPDRRLIVGLGLGVGLLLGGLWLWRSGSRAAGAGENAYAT